MGDQPHVEGRSDADVSKPGAEHVGPNPHSCQPVSVITTVLNDVEGLQPVLASLAKQTRPPDEIVIVDGGSRPDQLQSLKTLVSGYPNARLLAGDPCNIAEGRNRAIRSARHEIIACIDAGCRAQPDWLEKLIAPLANRQVDVVGGAYQAHGRNVFERVVAAVTMPGSLTPVDPLRFNPSARSLAFRRSVWELAGGFPNWLQTAEDTLFDLKLRSLPDALVYSYAPEAVVTWRPRRNPAAVFRQFAGYARGEARIGRGRAEHRYQTLRYVAAVVWAVAAWAAIAADYRLWAVVCALLVAAILIRPQHRIARRAARQVRTVGGYWLALAISEWTTLARWVGYRLGRWDRRRDPQTFVDRLRRYFGRDAIEVDVPAWTMKSAPIPRTLVVAWHWPVVNRASANVMANLFRTAPPSAFRVITRRVDSPKDDRTAAPPLVAEFIDWPLPDDKPVRLKTWWADVTTAVKMVLLARRIDRDWPVERVLAVFPGRYGLLAGWAIARLLNVRFVPYMHDLLGETIVTSSRLKRRFWQWVERRALAQAWVTIVPTHEFAQHYHQRGVHKTWVVPHCLPADVASSEPPPPKDKLRLVYCGAIYEPHEDAIAALIQATHNLDDTELVFLSRDHVVLHGRDVRWLPRAQAMEQIEQADVCVVALGWNTPYPKEVFGCFPSKIVDYLAVGRPILAVVPAMSFVDRLIHDSRCGVTVNARDVFSIRAGLDKLRNPEARAEMIANGQALAKQLRSEDWMQQLLQRLVLGVQPGESPPPFPGINDVLPEESVPVGKPTTTEERDSAVEISESERRAVVTV